MNCVKYWMGILSVVILIIVSVFGTAYWCDTYNDPIGGVSLFVLSCVCSIIVLAKFFSKE